MVILLSIGDQWRGSFLLNHRRTAFRWGDSCPAPQLKLRKYSKGQPPLTCVVPLDGEYEARVGERAGFACLTTMPIDGYGLSMKVPMTTLCLKDCSFGEKGSSTSRSSCLSYLMWFGHTDSTSIHVGSIWMRGTITRKHRDSTLLSFLWSYPIINRVNSGSSTSSFFRGSLMAFLTRPKVKKRGR